MLQPNPDNQESFTSVQQQTDKRAKELEQEIKGIKKSKRYWIAFWIIIILGWSSFYLLTNK